MTVRKARLFKREEADQLVPLADLVLLLPMKRALGCPDPDVESRRSAGFPMTARKVNSYSRKLEGEDRQVFSPHLILLSQTMDFLIDISIHLFIWSTTSSSECYGSAVLQSKIQYCRRRGEKTICLSYDTSISIHPFLMI